VKSEREASGGIIKNKNCTSPLRLKSASRRASSGKIRHSDIKKITPLNITFPQQSHLNLLELLSGTINPERRFECAKKIT
jgi:hypothetical protein